MPVLFKLSSNPHVSGRVECSAVGKKPHFQAFKAGPQGHGGSSACCTVLKPAAQEGASNSPALLQLLWCHLRQGCWGWSGWRLHLLLFWQLSWWLYCLCTGNDVFIAQA